MLTYKPSNFRKKESPINYDRSLMSKMLRKHILYIYIICSSQLHLYMCRMLRKDIERKWMEMLVNSHSPSGTTWHNAGLDERIASWKYLDSPCNHSSTKTKKWPFMEVGTCNVTWAIWYPFTTTPQVITSIHHLYYRVYIAKN